VFGFERSVEMRSAIGGTAKKFVETQTEDTKGRLSA
jgi:hypothetical protein